MGSMSTPEVSDLGEPEITVLDELHRRCVGYEDRAREAESDSRALRDQIKQRTLRINELETQHEALRHQLDRAEANARERIHALTTRLDEFKTAVQTVVMELARD